MKNTVSHHKKQSRMLALVLSVALLGLFPGLTAAGMSQKYGLTLKKNFGPQIMLDQTLFNVNIPLAISNLPGPWKNAKLHTMVAVIFMDAAGEMVGYGLAEGGQEFIPLDIALDNGGYNGTVVVPIRMSMGAITGKTCCVTIVLAKLGDQIMFIGSSTGGTAPSSGNCGDIVWSGITPGTILAF